MKRSDFLKRIGLAIGAIAALPAVALKAMERSILLAHRPPSIPSAIWEYYKKDVDGLWHHYVYAIPPERFYKDGEPVRDLPFHITFSSSPYRQLVPPKQA